MKINGHDTDQAKEIAFHKYCEHLYGPGYILRSPMLAMAVREHFDSGFNACLHLVKTVLAHHVAEGDIKASKITVDAAKENAKKGGVLSEL